MAKVFHRFWHVWGSRASVTSGGAACATACCIFQQHRRETCPVAAQEAWSTSSSRDNKSYFHGRVALVTGGGGGIGRATALAFAREGARVVVADIDAKRAMETCILGEKEDAQSRMVSFPCDVASANEVQKLIDFAVTNFGAIHHCFNNAGFEGARAPLHEVIPEEYDRVMSVNAGGVFHCMACEVKQMLSQLPEASGDDSPYTPKAIDACGLTIVNSSSTAGLAAMPEFSPYCASKHAVIGLTRCAAKEYGSKGIRINCICPSTTATPMVERFASQWPDWQAKQNSSFPVGRVGTPEEVASAVLWLSSSSCPMICGTCLNIDGALSA